MLTVIALERTGLAYLRTSLMLANIGVIVAQLFSLQQPASGFGYSAVGKPLATVCLSGSIVVTILGVVRTWRYQKALINRKALSGGPELMLVGAVVLVVGSVSLGRSRIVLTAHQILCVFLASLIRVEAVDGSTPSESI